MAKQMTITIDDTTGETSVEMAGFKGRSCTDASRFIEQALGTVAQRKRKKAFYAVDKLGEKNKEVCG